MSWLDEKKKSSGDRMGKENADAFVPPWCLRLCGSRYVGYFFLARPLGRSSGASDVMDDGRRDFTDR